MSGSDASAHASWKRIASVLIVGAAAVLSGCSGGPRPEIVQTVEPTTPVTAAAEIERPDVPPPPEQLTFAAGADLDPSIWMAGWHAEPIDMTNGYPVVFPRDDWEEVHFGEGCEGSRYHRFSLEGLDLTLDDRSLTDQFLAQILEMPVADVSEGGSDITYPVVGRWPMEAEFRVRAGGWTDGGTWLAAARVFGALDTALVMQLNCEPGPMTGATGQQMFDLLPTVVGEDAFEVGLGRVDWNLVESLDFEAGADLVESSEAQWVDGPLMDDASWTFDDGEPDDGSWSFASVDGDCTADYEQSLLDEQYGDLGDRDASDELLSLWLDDPEDIAFAVDGHFALGVPGNDLLAMRLIEGEDSAGRWVTAVRALAGPLFGFAVSVTCAEGDPLDALELLMAKSAVQVVP